MSAEKAPRQRRKLTLAREEQHLTQQQVADQLGVTKLTVGRWERGEATPHPYVRRKLCALFSLSEHDLLLAEDEVPATNTHAAFLFDPTIPSLPHFIGREEAFLHIKRCLCRGKNVALTAALNGIPGVGKTALSVALAHDREVQASFRDGILWAGLGPHANIPALLYHWGTLLGLSPSEMDAANEQGAWVRTIRNAIGLRSLLLVIDDAWSLADATALKIGGPNCAYLLTTRFPEVANFLAFENAITLEEFSEEESLALLRFLAPVMVEQEKQRIQQLIRAVGGLPLALTLIGNYLRHRSSGRQLRRISSALEQLENVETRLHLSELRGPVEVHTSLSSNTVSLSQIIAVSDQQLSEASRGALYALSLFPAKPNSFSEEAALAVAGCDVEHIDALIDAGLLTPVFGDRLQMHQTIHDYASYQREKRPDTAAPARRLVAYVVKKVVLPHPDQSKCQQEQALIGVALDLAMTLLLHTEFLQILLASFTYFFTIGAYRAMERYLHHALQLLPQDQETLITLFFDLGCVLRPQGRYDEAQTAFVQALALARQEEDKRSMSQCLSELGWIYVKMGQYQQAEEALDEALTLARQCGDPHTVGRILKTLGAVADYEGRYEQAAQYLEDALQLARELGDQHLASSLYINIGVNLGSIGEGEKAEKALMEGLLLARKTNARETQCVLLVNLGELYCQRETPQALQLAEAYLQEGLTIATDIGVREWQGVLLLTLGSVRRKQGIYVQADEWLQQSLSLGKEVKSYRIVCNALCELGDIALAQGRVHDASALFQNALDESRTDQEMMALTHFGYARSCRALGDLESARQHAEQSLRLFAHMGHGWTGKVQQWLAQLA
ncbi:helix-turn-helix domain-containing protein [Ktedonospora formicarum]|uniref:HTH cro/C1-type domain-containing protein n=1 Tax=Ktedonospora formicarum TaxID=2778364 RepID=A0A8J3I762_9CHLR|nr:helix-turn-helix domain-containing protein [Ktedonospora formicarum]GHO50804.1 hypothetical protein KSX_89670 [Ktedonospora formicarum]